MHSTLFFITLLVSFVLSVPNVMSDKFLNFLCLLDSQVLLTDFVGAEGFHKSSYVLDKDVISCDHDLLLARVLSGWLVTS